MAEMLRREAARFPPWFRTEAERLATISTETSGDRGIAFYGDERQGLAPRDLFDRSDAERALINLEYVAALCERLLASVPDSDAETTGVDGG